MIPKIIISCHISRVKKSFVFDFLTFLPVKVYKNNAFCYKKCADYDIKDKMCSFFAIIKIWTLYILCRMSRKKEGHVPQENEKNLRGERYAYGFFTGD